MVLYKEENSTKTRLFINTDFSICFLFLFKKNGYTLEPPCAEAVLTGFQNLCFNSFKPGVSFMEHRQT